MKFNSLFLIISEFCLGIFSHFQWYCSWHLFHLHFATLFYSWHLGIVVYCGFCVPLLRPLWKSSPLLSCCGTGILDSVPVVILLNCYDAYLVSFVVYSCDRENLPCSGRVVRRCFDDPLKTQMDFFLCPRSSVRRMSLVFSRFVNLSELCFSFSNVSEAAWYVDFQAARLKEERRFESLSRRPCHCRHSCSVRVVLVVDKPQPRMNGRASSMLISGLVFHAMQIALISIHQMCAKPGV